MDLLVRVDVAEKGDWAIVAVQGQVDVATAPRLRQRLVELAAAGHHRMVLDLEGVEFVDSFGLGVLVGALKRARVGGGEVVVVCTRERVLRLFEVTGLDRVFRILNSTDALP